MLIDSNKQPEKLKTIYNVLRSLLCFQHQYKGYIYTGCQPLSSELISMTNAQNSIAQHIKMSYKFRIYSNLDTQEAGRDRQLHNTNGKLTWHLMSLSAMSRLSGSTSWANFKLVTVYSWPQYTL